MRVVDCININILSLICTYFCKKQENWLAAQPGNDFISIKCVVVLICYSLISINLSIFHIFEFFFLYYFLRLTVFYSSPNRGFLVVGYNFLKSLDIVCFFSLNRFHYDFCININYLISLDKDSFTRKKYNSTNYT